MASPDSQLGLQPEERGRTVTLWRAVGNSELADIRATATFRNPPGLEVKYFCLSAEDAARYARLAYRRWPQEGTYTLVGTEISRELITPEMHVTVDRRIGAIVSQPSFCPA